MIGLGTAAIGRPQYINLRQGASNYTSLDEFKAIGLKLLESAYNMGIRYFDTAPGYGIAEELMIQWISEKQYQDVEIATKWGYTYTANFDPNATIHEVKEHSLSKLKEQWEQSQNLLPHLTTYQIHSATIESGVLENQEVLEKLSELKNTQQLHIGLTTSGANQVDVIEKALEIEIDGQRLFDAFQVTYNVMDQSLTSISDVLHGSNKRIIIKEALANGRVFPCDRFSNYDKHYMVLRELAGKYEVGIDAIALRFCVDSIAPYCVLSGASLSKQLEENLKVNQFELEEEEISRFMDLKVSPESYWAERKQLAWN